MLRVNVGLSRKVSKDYNSTGFSINLEGEVTAAISDPEAVVAQVHEIYDLAEEALALQIDRSQGVTAIASRDEEREQNHGQNGNGRRTSSDGNGGRNGNREVESATNKQLQYLLSIGKRQQLSTRQLENRIAEILDNQVGLYDLTKPEAGRVIDALTGGGDDNGRGNGRRG